LNSLSDTKADTVITAWKKYESETDILSGIDKMRERRSQAPFEFLQAYFKILTF
jgi:hypothetical protein